MTGAGRTVHRGLTIALTGTRQVESRRGVLAELFERVLAPFADGPAADRGWLLGGAAGVGTSALRFLADQDRRPAGGPDRCPDANELPAARREFIAHPGRAGSAAGQVRSAGASRG